MNRARLTVILLMLSGLAIGQSATPPAGATSAGQATESKSTGAPATKIDPVKDADIRQLMKLTGADKLADQMMIAMETSLKPSLMTAFPPGEYREQLVNLFFEKFRSKASAGMMDIAIPAYDKYFTDEEIRALTAFYDTPAGKKAVTVMPQLLAEVMQTSQAWSQQLGRESMEEVFAEHPELKQAMDDAAKKEKSH